MTREDIDSQAAFWVDRMNRPVFDPEEGVAFDRWMGSDPAHREAYAAMSAIWEDDVPGLARLDVSAVSPAAVAEICTGEGRLRKTMIFAAAAVAVLAVGIGAVTRLMPHTYSSTPGAGATIALADGSQVRLGGNSAITVQYLPWHRSIELTRGEAAFDVVRDTSRPFAVDTGGAQVVVLGTAFHVDRLGKDAMAVQVSRGAVQVCAGDRTEGLAAGQAARISGKVIHRVALQEEDRNWEAGWFVAHDVPLSDLVEKLRRYSHRAIHIPDPGISKRLIVGRFKVSEPEAALEAVRVSYGLKVIEKSGGIFITS
ncbi:FecR family protein [Novosphingobium sp. PhB57]|uniref:FecR family protein n=1 Tax=Novosphingobium sp. PhB57 TaxID=2485107 RepID=UPI001051EA54|nr:FecR domain-containing protein [Novosphingobium sp. PhB57]TCU54675.1 FecR family protein [Novosphingobium sp. PhB57]